MPIGDLRNLLELHRTDLTPSSTWCTTKEILKTKNIIL